MLRFYGVSLMKIRERAISYDFSSLQFSCIIWCNRRRRLGLHLQQHYHLYFCKLLLLPLSTIVVIRVCLLLDVRGGCLVVSVVVGGCGGCCFYLSLGLVGPRTIVPSRETEPAAVADTNNTIQQIFVYCC